MRYNSKQFIKKLKAVHEQAPDSMEELYYNFSDFVYNTALSFTKNPEDSNDIVQEVFIKLYYLKEEQLPKSNSIAWLYTVTKNCSLVYIRKNKERTNIEKTNKEVCCSIENILFQKYLLDILDDIEREIVIQHVLNKFKHKEIASFLNLPEGTIRWKYTHAIKKLKSALEDK